MNRLAIIAVLASLVIGAVAGRSMVATPAQAAPAATAQRWEYATIQITSAGVVIRTPTSNPKSSSDWPEAMANFTGKAAPAVGDPRAAIQLLGDDGWELVSHVTGARTEWWFKRPAQ